MKSVINVFQLFLSNKRTFFSAFLQKIHFIFPEKLYLKLLFRCHLKYKLSFNNPRTYSEKLQWLKIYNRDPEYTKMVDKHAVKDYVSAKIGTEYIIPTLGCWSDPQCIDWDTLPDRFVLKTTHSGGCSGVIICDSKRHLNTSRAVISLSDSMKGDIYRSLREWPYKNVTKQIIAEELLIPEDGDLKDYKVLCFNGRPRLIEFHSGRFTGSHTQDFYDTEWNRTDITQGGYGDMAKDSAPKPDCLEEMLKLSEILSKDMPHVRIDWYFCNGRLYFGEITFFDGSGLVPFDRMEDELLLGSWINLDLAYSRKTNKKR